MFGIDSYARKFAYSESDRLLTKSTTLLADATAFSYILGL